MMSTSYARHQRVNYSRIVRKNWRDIYFFGIFIRPGHFFLYFSASVSSGSKLAYNVSDEKYGYNLSYDTPSILVKWLGHQYRKVDHFSEKSMSALKGTNLKQLDLNIGSEFAGLIANSVSNDFSCSTIHEVSKIPHLYQMTLLKSYLYFTKA